jgi:hypothetical protein
MACAGEAELEAAVYQAFAIHAFAGADVAQNIDGPLFEHARAHSFLNMTARPVLDNDGVYAFEVQHLGKQQTGGSGAQNSDFSSA